MSTLTEIRTQIDTLDSTSEAESVASAFIEASERVLEAWLEAHGKTPTDKLHEGSRLLALHRQGAKGDPSFNACRETCRELVYRYNLIRGAHPDTDEPNTLEMMRHLSRHLYLFISGKMQDAKLGDFCCSSKPLRLN